MTDIDPDAANDISASYYHVKKEYPNPWTLNDVYAQVDNDIEAIGARATSYCLFCCRLFFVFEMRINK